MGATQDRESEGKGQEYRIPLVIGVTGHIDLEPTQISDLKAEVRQFLENLRRQYPHTPLLVLSSLAPGADQLVAQVALELGVPLRAVLPMPLEAYKATFGRYAEAAAALDDLLRLSSGEVVQIPLAEGIRPEDLAAKAEARDGQYERASAYIVRSCHVLLALWDGADPRLQAGTARTITMALRGAGIPGEGERRPLDLAGGVPVRWIEAARIKSERRLEHRHADWLYPASYPGVKPRSKGAPPTNRIAEDITGLGRRYLDDLNAELARLETRLRAPGGREVAAIASHVESLMPPIKGEDPIHARRMQVMVTEEERALVELRARIDHLATRSKALARALLLGMLWLVLLGVLAYEVFAHLLHSTYTLLGAYVVLIMTALLLWRLRSTHYRRFLDFRAIAETMRVQFFWIIAGVPDSTTDHYMRTHRGDFEWIRWAVIASEVWLRLRPAAPTVRIRPRGVDHVTEVWIGEQLRYFERKSAEQGAQGWRFGVLSAALAGLATAVVIALLVAGMGWSQWVAGLPEHSVNYVTIAVALLFVSAELVRVWGDTQELAVNAKRFAWMTTVFGEAKQGLDDIIDRREDVGGASDQPETQVRAQRVLFELGKEALLENTEWIALHKHRPVELPHSPHSPH